MTKAYAYLRVSGKGQIDGDGFTRQLQAIRTYAKRHDIRIMKVFQEKGVSGAMDLDNRPAFVQLMEALHSNGVKLVLVEKLDRLARDLMIQESILRDLNNYGFSLMSVMESDLCSNDPTRKLMRQILGAFAEYEKSLIVAKLRGARQRTKAKAGRCEGRKPFGHFEGENAVINRMQELRSQKMAYDKIADALNAEGLNPRQGERWYAGVVQRILKAQAKNR